MRFDAEKFYKDFRIPHVKEGHKHCQPGWVQIACPFCTGNPGWHLGYCIAGDFYNCWRCGSKDPLDVVQKLTKQNRVESMQILRIYLYSGGPKTRAERKSQSLPRKSYLTFPPGTGNLQEIHRNYLLSRNFDPDKLTEIWDLMGTTHLGRLGAEDYRFRIIAPIYHHKELVSFQGRDVTGMAELRYKACRQEDEVRDHKECLYGLDLVPGKKAVVVEGITESWRLGPGAVSTFGIKYTKKQVEILCLFDAVDILYDSRNDDPQAGEQADKLAYSLAVFVNDVNVHDLDHGDPAQIPQEEADEFMSKLLKNSK